MITKSSTLSNLLEATWQSPVFGDSFDPDISLKTTAVQQQITAITEGFRKEFGRYIERCFFPAMELEDVEKIVDQITPKTVSFCPALAAGELDDIPRLTALSVAIGLMYWADQTMDRGDEAMPLGIQLWAGEFVSGPGRLARPAYNYSIALEHISEKIQQSVRPEDAALSLACFREQVLLNEVRLYGLSRKYCNAKNTTGFIARNATKIAKYMIIDAGFPSVASPLYAVYRQQDPTLPSLAEVYAEPSLLKLLQICNAVVRVADELGDSQMDTGQDPEWGIFTINLFNQAQPELLKAFFKQAYITDVAQQKVLYRAFDRFPRNKKLRKKWGDYIIQTFFDHARLAIQNIPPSLQQRYELYIKLCKRVLEIGYVNKVGDMSMAEMSQRK